jgi:hypothetical protein
MQDIDVEITFSETKNEWCAERQFQYRCIRIDFRKELLATDYKNIVETIFHELIHYYTWFREPFMDSLQEDFEFTKRETDMAGNWILDLEELAVTQLARAFTKLYIKKKRKKF